MHPQNINTNIKNVLRILFWETTAACNLECIHCRRLDNESFPEQNDLSTDKAKDILYQISQIGSPIIVLSGGEPLLRKDIFDIAKYASEKQLKTALATNGTLINKDIAKNISFSGIKKVSVSLDGASPQTHNKFRKLPGSFEAAVRGLNYISCEGIPTQINCTVSKHNAHELENLFKLSLELKAESLHIFLLVPVGCGAEIMESESLSDIEYENVLESFFNLSMKYDIQTKATCAPHYQRIIRKNLKDNKLSEDKKEKIRKLLSKGCIAGQNACFISHNGEIFPCGYLPIKCGDLNKQTFKEIWENAEVFKILRNDDLLEGKCGYCEFKSACMGCRARAYFKNGNIMAEEPFCSYIPRK